MVICVVVWISSIEFGVKPQCASTNVRPKIAREREREREREGEKNQIKMNLYFFFHLIGIVGWWLWRSRDNISIARNEFEPFFTWGKNINEYFLFLLWMINKKGMFKMNICLGRSVRYVNFLYFEMIFIVIIKAK